MQTKNEPNKTIEILDKVFLTIHGLRDKMPSKRAGKFLGTRTIEKYVGEGMPHGYYGDMLVWDPDRLSEVREWISQRKSQRYFNNAGRK